MFKRLLVPIDGSKLSQKALDKAIEIALFTKSKLTVLNVVPPYPAVYAGDGYMFEPMTGSKWEQTTTASSEKVLQAALKHCADRGILATTLSIRDDPPYAGIIAAAKKQKSDLIVMASHGRRGVSALLLGSETTKVLTHTNTPVLVVR